MEIIETLGLFSENLKPIDFGGAMALVSEAGWNQTAADWEWMCAAGDAIVLKDKNSDVVASALALPYGSEFGWISMVLVSKNMRRKGLATYLLDNRISWLQSKGLTPILDATEDGEKVYRNIGFKGDLTFTRWQGTGHNTSGATGAIRRASPPDFDKMCQLDAGNFCADRKDLLSNLMTRTNSFTLVCERVENGFVVFRQGSTASQLGPLIASSERHAIALIDAALCQCEGPVFFDLLDQRESVAEYLTASGFEKQRSFKRMSLGKSPVFYKSGTSFIVAGPEYG